MQLRFSEELDSFLEFISPWIAAYRWATISYVGFNGPEGPVLLMGRILLEPSRTSVENARFSFASNSLVASHALIEQDAGKLEELISHCREGSIPRIEEDKWIGLDNKIDGRAHFNSIRPPRASDALLELRFPTVVITGGNKGEVFKDVDPFLLNWELSASSTPFQDFNELLAACGFPTWQNWGDFTGIEIVAKPPTMISESSQMNEGEAVIECRLASNLDLEALRIGYKMVRGGKVERGVVTGPPSEVRQDGDVQVATYRRPTGTAPFLQLFANYGGVAHHRWWIGDASKAPNLRQIVHAAFDPQSELLREMLLEPDRSKPYAFENAVATLLHLLGFSAVGYGHIPKLQDGPDVLAMTMQGHVLAVECTVGLLNKNDKLSKLTQRVTVVRRALEEAGHAAFRIQAAIVTPLSREEVSADLEFAGKHGIAVVCREDLERALIQALQAPDSDSAFDDICGLVPPEGRQGTFTL